MINVTFGKYEIRSFALVKYVSNIAFGFVLLIFSFQQVNTFYQFIHFKINQEEIALEFCVNKNKPELQCDGKCHLAKKLEQEPTYSVDIDSKRKKVPVPQEKLRIQENILFVSDLRIKIPQPCCKTLPPVDYYQFLVSEAHLKEQEHPPSAII